MRRVDPQRQHAVARDDSSDDIHHGPASLVPTIQEDVRSTARKNLRLALSQIDIGLFDEAYGLFP
jgi:hypothetical protein